MNLLKKTGLLTLAILLIGIMSVNAAMYSDLQLGVRASGMGGAYVSVARNADAVYWNAAALTLTEKNNVSFMYSDAYNLGINESYLAYAQPFEKNKLGIGASWYRQSVDLKEGFGSSATSNAWVDDMFIFGVGIKMKNNLYAGASMKRFKISTETSSSGNLGTSGLGFDLSLLFLDAQYSEDLPPIDIGVQIRNIATDISGENVDPSYKLGISAKFFDEQLLVSTEIDMDKDTEDGNYTTNLRIGGEYMINDVFSLRMGLNDGDFALGLGFTLDKRLAVDYSFEKDLGDLNKDNHRFALSLWF